MDGSAGEQLGAARLDKRTIIGGLQELVQRRNISRRSSAPHYLASGAFHLVFQLFVSASGADVSGHAASKPAWSAKLAHKTCVQKSNSSTAKASPGTALRIALHVSHNAAGEGTAAPSTRAPNGSVSRNRDHSVPAWTFKYKA